MKAFLAILSLAGAAVAQNIAIGFPQAGGSIVAGDSTVVSVWKPNSLTGSQEIGIGITLHHCTQTPCEDASEALGLILYSGPFQPKPSDSAQPPQQNFTITIPSSYAEGDAVLSVVHANLVGAGPFFHTEIVHETVTIVNDAYSPTTAKLTRRRPRRGL